MGIVETSTLRVLFSKKCCKPVIVKRAVRWYSLQVLDNDLHLRVGIGVLPRSAIHMERCHDGSRNEGQPAKHQYPGLQIQRDMMFTYHSRAPKTMAAVPAPQAPPLLPHLRSPQSAATATHAANQKIMQRASAARMMYLWARAGNLAGVRMRKATVRRVHMEVKSMKLTECQPPHVTSTTGRRDVSAERVTVITR